ELRRGRAIAVQDAAGRTWRLVVPLETASGQLLEHALGQPGVALAVTGARAAALRVPCDFDEVLQLALPADIGAAQLLELGHHWEADGWRAALGEAVPHATCADALTMAAVQLAKSAQLLPALLVCDAQDCAVPGPVSAVRIDQVERYAMPDADDLVRVSEARVPLRQGVMSRLVLFR